MAGTSPPAPFSWLASCRRRRCDAWCFWRPCVHGAACSGASQQGKAVLLSFSTGVRRIASKAEHCCTCVCIAARRACLSGGFHRTKFLGPCGLPSSLTTAKKKHARVMSIPGSPHQGIHPLQAPCLNLPAAMHTNLQHQPQAHLPRQAPPAAPAHAPSGWPPSRW